MSDDPCAGLKAASLEAARESQMAHSATMRWVSTEPLDPVKDIVPKTPEETEQMIADYKRAREAAEKSFNAMTAWGECLDQHR